MTDYTITTKQFETWLKGNRERYTQFAFATGTATGTDYAYSYNEQNVSFQYPTTYRHHGRVSAGAHSHTAKTGYKRISVPTSPNRYFVTISSEHSVGLAGGTHTLMPKDIGGYGGNGSTTTWQLYHMWISNNTDTTAFTNYLEKYWQNPAAYQNPLTWLYPSGYMPYGSPIYFNDFYHIRTPLNT